MDISEIIGKSADYAKKLFSDMGRLLILIVLNLIPVVNLIVGGYMVKVIKEPTGSPDLPPLRNYGDLFVQGLKVAVATFLYTIVPMLLIIFGVFSAFPTFYGIPRDVRSILGVRLLAGFGALLVLAGVLLLFLVAIIMAMAIVHMVKSDAFSKAFAINEVLGIIGKIGWGKYVLWMVIIFVLVIVVGSLGAIPVIGWIVSLIIGPVFGVFATRSASLIYTEGMPEALPPAAPPYPVTTAPLFCTTCGARLPQDASFCPDCGHKVR